MLLSAAVAIVLAAQDWALRLMAFCSPGLLALWLWRHERRVPEDIRRPPTTLLSGSLLHRGANRRDIHELWDHWRLDSTRRGG